MIKSIITTATITFFIGANAFAGTIVCKAKSENSYDKKVQVLVKTNGAEKTKKGGTASVTISKSLDKDLNIVNTSSVYKRFSGGNDGILFLFSDKIGRSVELHLSNFKTSEGNIAVLLVEDSTETTTQDLVCK